MQAPYPEEFNRQVVSKIATIHFSPTDYCKRNLIKRVEEEKIFVTGNTVIDSLFHLLEKLNKKSNFVSEIKSELDSLLGFEWQKEKFILITGHRRENFGDGFYQICKSIGTLASKYQGIRFVYPVHLNPNVQAPVYNILAKYNNVHLIKPLDYQSFISLLKFCYLVLTDSGGIQEEAPSLGKPVLLMRESTERPEGLDAGCVKLIGANFERIQVEFLSFWTTRIMI